MKILIACEFSQIVTKAFRGKGHEAYSCDIIPAEGGHPEWHIHDDVLKHLEDRWDMMIAFPPCTDLAVSGAAWFEQKRKDGRQQKSIEFFMKLVNADIPKIVIENPVGIMSTIYRKPDQIVQPYQFGHDTRKSTCLWLKNLPLLKPSKIVDPVILTYHNGRKETVWHAKTGGGCGKIRSITYQGVAEAMSLQWGNL